VKEKRRGWLAELPHVEQVLNGGSRKRSPRVWRPVQQIQGAMFTISPKTIAELSSPVIRVVAEE